MGVNVRSRAMLGYVVTGDQFIPDVQKKLKRAIKAKDFYEKIEGVEQVLYSLCPQSKEKQEENQDETQEEEKNTSQVTNGVEPLYFQVMMDVDGEPVKTLSQLRIFWSNLCPLEIDQGMNETIWWECDTISLVERIQQVKGIEGQLRLWILPETRLVAVMVNHFVVN